MLRLELKNGEVYCEGDKLYVNRQVTKGPGNEVVKIEGLEGSNGQKWISLSKLKEGMNNLVCKSSSHQGGTRTIIKYQFTEEEKLEYDRLESMIEECKQKQSEISEKASKRHRMEVQFGNFNSLSREDQKSKIEELEEMIRLQKEYMERNK